MVKKHPPYALHQCGVIKNKKLLHDEVFVFLGKNSWKKARTFLKTRPVIVLPENTNPQDYFWGFVKGYQVLAFDTSGVGSEVIRRLAYELLRAGAAVVRVVLACNKLVVFRHGGGL